MAPLELELQSLLILHGSAPPAAAQLLRKYEKQKLSIENLELVATFCLHAGLSASLVYFLIDQIEAGSKIPWAHFAEALSLSGVPLKPQLAKLVIEGAREQGQLSHLSRSRILDSYDSSLRKEREARRKQLQENVLHLKRDLMMQLEMYRSQELEKEEGDVLRTLTGMFPKDPQIQEAHSQYRSRKALRLLEEKVARPKEAESNEREPELDDETLKQLQIIGRSMEIFWDESQRDPDLGVDFAVAHWMWDHPEGSLPFLRGDDLPPSSVWMRTETLLRTRRYIELLNELLEIENRWAHQPETTFAVLYLRAQALWGSGQKIEAIEILEGIAAIRPHFRSVTALLNFWKRGHR